MWSPKSSWIFGKISLPSSEDSNYWSLVSHDPSGHLKLPSPDKGREICRKFGNFSTIILTLCVECVVRNYVSQVQKHSLPNVHLYLRVKLVINGSKDLKYVLQYICFWNRGWFLPTSLSPQVILSLKKNGCQGVVCMYVCLFRAIFIYSGPCDLRPLSQQNMVLNWRWS